MSLKIGIVGLPNVGKSTLFNALTRSKGAVVANYPFCTIDPNVGVVEVPDKRLKALSEIVKPQKVIPTIIEFADIAGLVKGASLGEGLGNQFLAHIRECEAIAHVVRFFEDPNVIHVHNRVHPKEDAEIIESELILADLQTLEKRLAKVKGSTKTGDLKAVAYYDLLQRLNDHLASGKRAILLNPTVEEKDDLHDLHLLTLKPLIYIANIHENQIGKITAEELHAKLGVDSTVRVVPVCAKIEEEIGSLSDQEMAEYLEAIGLPEIGLNALIHAAYDTLGLATYFTAGVKEVRAWTIHKGTPAPLAAGVIHTDFIKSFVRAEVISYDDYIACGGESGSKEKGKMRVEGKDYIVKDGDVIYFRIGN